MEYCDFLDISHKPGRRKDTYEVVCDFRHASDSQHILVYGNHVEVWDPNAKKWVHDPSAILADVFDPMVQDYVDKLRDRLAEKGDAFEIIPQWPSRARSKIDKLFADFCKSHTKWDGYMDPTPVFADTPVIRENYSTHHLPYSPKEGSTEAWDKMLTTWYDPSEVKKIEWMFGSILTGECRNIQKFFIFSGGPGTGKSSVINILTDMIDGYWETVDAKALTSGGDFAAASLAGNPLVGVQHDTDLSKVRDNSLINSVCSHEPIVVNEKYAQPYSMVSRTTLVLATNETTAITSADSGLLRRMIDIRSSKRKLGAVEYAALMKQVKSEHGAIAYKCMRIFERMGPSAYDAYVDVQSWQMNYHGVGMFISEHDSEFRASVDISATRLFRMYKEWAEQNGYRLMNKTTLFNKAKGAWTQTESREDGLWAVGYIGFAQWKDSQDDVELSVDDDWLALDISESALDEVLSDAPAQYATDEGFPKAAWDDVTTLLKDLDTSRQHYVRPPQNLVVIDFDLKVDGEKSATKNLEAARHWPRTYAEYSKSGSGIHLHYWYEGDTDSLGQEFAEGIEVKVYRGKSALRRRVTKCNDLSIATLPADYPLPQKKERAVNFEKFKDENKLRNQIKKALRKEVHPATKPSVDFIAHLLNEAYGSGQPYDVSDMKSAVAKFALGSTHQADICMAAVSKMHFKSQDDEVSDADGEIDWEPTDSPDGPIVFFDIEVFPNLLLICWKKEGDFPVQRMKNPSPELVEKLVRNFRLVGFNNRNYDNHILYGRMLGYNEQMIYELSKKIVSGEGETSRNARFRQAYNLSYTDIYDFSAKKQSLKKWEIELGISHAECSHDWDSPVEENRVFEDIAEYCENDVRATEALWNHLQADFVAREILADISGLSVNHTTNNHTQAIIFGQERNPQKDFVYTDLSTLFPGYEFDDAKPNGEKSTYRGEFVGEGGYVYTEPGVYENVGLLDIASMHPTSLEQLDLFGPYTKNFSDIKNARIAIKHGDLEAARHLLDGKLAKYLDDPDILKNLAQALKIVINSVYGLTSAKFPNRCKDPRNVDNIVAKRGALFMIELKHYLQDRGIQVIHIKTDSVKIPNVTQEVVDLVCEFGKKYGYSFEWEATYDRICLVDKAQYIAHDEHGWHATGKMFLRPVVFKSLFSHEELTLDDYSETFSVKTSLWLDVNEMRPGTHHYLFVGRVGRFVPVKPGRGGCVLNRLNDKTGEYSAPPGTIKDSSTDPKTMYRWVEREKWRFTELDIDDIDFAYSQTQIDAARAAIEQYMPFDTFVTTN